MTIAEVLKPAGYSTYMTGKWHVTKHVNPKDESEKFNWPQQRGFDRYYGIINGASSLWDPNSLVRGNELITCVNDSQYKPTEPYHFTDAISDNAVKFVKEHKPNTPFFMYVSYTAAHWPMHARPRDIQKYDGMYDAGYQAVRKKRLKKMKRIGLVADDTPLNPAVGKWDGIDDKPWEAACMEVYAAMVDQMDQGIGRIVAALKETGQYDNTLILFLQDNGGCAEGCGRGGNKPVRAEAPTLQPLPVDLVHYFGSVPKQTRDGWPILRGRVMPGPADTYIGYGKNWANVSNTPFREYKHWVHEGGISTPLIAHWPEGIKGQNRWFKTPAHLIDLMATCVDLGKAKYPTRKNEKKIIPMEGISLRPAFENTALKRGRPIYFEHEGNRAVRDGKWKLVAKGVRGAWELYDMEQDRTEMHNLATKHPETTSRMVAQYEQWAKERGVVPFGSWRKARQKK
ncbi:MAG: sulfatase-like hydrolase/transferase [Planctomycetaceae bacterium]|nr:sulfatase-like hydrolase/transferase [Planctomycetaceae bacterium]